LREDPDIILVVKCATWKTIELAITAAPPATWFFGTLHTQSAAKTVIVSLTSSRPTSKQNPANALGSLEKASWRRHCSNAMTRNGRVAAFEVWSSIRHRQLGA